MLAISCIYGGEFPTKIIIQTIQKIFAHFVLKYKNARGGICVRTSSKSIIYIYTVYTAFLSEDFQNMFDFERKITTKVFYFEASQIYRWLTVEDFFGAEFFSSKNLLIWGPGGGFCRFQLPKKLGPSRHPGAWMPSQWGFMQAKQETRTIGFFHMLCICIYSL